MSKKKKKRPTRSRLYIDPVAVRAALYCKHMSMERLQRVTGYPPGTVRNALLWRQSPACRGGSSGRLLESSGE